MYFGPRLDSPLTYASAAVIVVPLSLPHMLRPLNAGPLKPLAGISCSDAPPVMFRDNILCNYKLCTQIPPDDHLMLRSSAYH